MNPELVQYCGQAIINYLGGNIKRFNRLKEQAMGIYLVETNKNFCSQCGELMVRAKIKNKHYSENVYICTSCGLVHGKRVANVRGYRAC